MPELSAWTDDPSAALGQIRAADCQDVHGTQRVRAELSPAVAGGPQSAGMSAALGNFIWPNSCQVDDSSCPAVR
ncbi:hypothetical protein SANTM175S_09812 [Streptomyces antimycoticus]